MTDPRIHEYETLYRCRLAVRLGSGAGQDGIVFRSNRLTAVKFFDRESRFQRELEVYHVISANEIAECGGHHVPQFVLADNSLQTIEMSLVDRPFVLDFAGAKRPEEIPDFEAYVLDEHYERLQELFGDRWQDALQVAEAFRLATGYTLLDIHPGNIAFRELV